MTYNPGLGLAGILIGGVLLTGTFFYEGGINTPMYSEKPMPDHMIQDHADSAKEVERQINRQSENRSTTKLGVEYFIHDHISQNGVIERQYEHHIYSHAPRSKVERMYGVEFALTRDVDYIAEDHSSCFTDRCQIHFVIKTEEFLPSGVLSYEAFDAMGNTLFENREITRNKMYLLANEMMEASMDVDIKVNDEIIGFSVDNTFAPYYRVEIEAKDNSNNTLNESNTFSSSITSGFSIQHNSLNSTTVSISEIASSAHHSMYKRTYHLDF